MKKRAKHYTDEYCPRCECEVRIPARIKPLPKCPRCKDWLVPCSVCLSSDGEQRVMRCKGCEKGSHFELHPGAVPPTGFRLGTIIRIADKAYSETTDLPHEQNVLHSHKGWRDTGDTLAEFIARELTDTFDVYASKSDQLQEAVRVMERARAQLENVECALKERLRKEYKKEGK